MSQKMERISEFNKIGAIINGGKDRIIMPKFIRKNLQGIEFVHVTTHGIDDKYIEAHINSYPINFEKVTIQEAEEIFNRYLENNRLDKETIRRLLIKNQNEQ